MLGQIAGDLIGNVLGPQLDAAEKGDDFVVEPDELTAQRQILAGQVVERS